MYSVNQLKKLANQKIQNIRSYLRKIRLRLCIDPKKVNHLKPTINCKKRWYGSSYGGFFVNPDLLNEDSIVYSFGIGKDISFDRKIISKHKCQVFGFDPTPKSIEYIRSLSKEPLFSFYDFGISTQTGIEKFFLPKNEKAVSGSLTLSKFVSEEKLIKVEMKSFDDISKKLGHQHIDVVKMDIEGAEYEVLETLISTKVTIHQLLVEFHDRFYPGEIKSKRITELLNKNGFEIFGASSNYEEISFINTKI
jgi:FkbM family methyltransferase